MTPLALHLKAILAFSKPAIGLTFSTVAMAIPALHKPHYFFVLLYPFLEEYLRKFVLTLERSLTRNSFIDFTKIGRFKQPSLCFDMVFSISVKDIFIQTGLRHLKPVKFLFSYFLNYKYPYILANSKLKHLYDLVFLEKQGFTMGPKHVKKKVFTPQFFAGIGATFFHCRMK